MYVEGCRPNEASRPSKNSWELSLVGWITSHLIPPEPLIVVTVVAYGLSSNQMLLCS